MNSEHAAHKAIGITLAVVSGFLIGSSFILKKKGLLDTNALGHDSGNNYAYLKSKMWWIGLIMMAMGEVANFMAYAFTPAILVTPLGALSVAVSAVLSSIFLKERLNFSAKIGCLQCILGATIIVLNAPEGNVTDTIESFVNYAISPGFVWYFIICCFIVSILIYQVAPSYGTKYPIVYVSICSIVGSFLVIFCQGFGAAVVYSANNWPDGNQFLEWPIYPIMAFIVFTILMQINYLNKALNVFSTAIVTPVYYVFFTGCTLTSSIVLFQGFHHISPAAAVSLLLGFLVIVGGVALLFEYNLKLTKYTAMGYALNEPCDDDQIMLKQRNFADHQRIRKRSLNEAELGECFQATNNSI